MSWLSTVIQRFADSRQPPYPTVDYPTIVEAYIVGPVRYESLDGSEFYDSTADISHIVQMSPFQKDGKMWSVSNLQKRSLRGWIKTNPDGYYWWRMTRLQTEGVPGSELGLYYRKPFSWRWDVAGTNLDGALRHFVWTKGYLGFHYD